MGAGTNVTVDSNSSGLAFAEETLGSPGTLPGTPVWYPLEPNTYSAFGGMVKSVKRETINSTRQLRKGVLTGIDIAAGFQVDFVTKSLYVPMKGFMFAAWREKDNLLPSAVTSTVYTVASGGAAFTTTSLLYAEGFGVATNNGLKTVTASGGTSVTPAGGLTVETPPTGALITRIGFQGASGDITLTLTSGVVTMGSTVLDFTTLGLIPGEWLWIGGDSAALQFATAGCNGFYRMKTIAAHAVVFDRVAAGAATDAGAAKTVQVFLGHVIKNEYLPANQVFRTYTLERQLNTTNFQYETGCGANTLALNVAMGAKVTADLTFIGMNETFANAAKGGTRLTLPLEVGYNTGSSFTRMDLLDDSNGGAALAVYLTDVKLTISNNMVADQAIRNNLGPVDLTAGDFTVAGTCEAYFSSYAAVQAVQANHDVGISFGMVENVTTPGVGAFAQGWLFDVPLLMLGDARLKVAKDTPIKLPLNLDAAAHSVLNHTLLAMRFAYLPQLAL